MPIPRRKWELSAPAVAHTSAPLQRASLVAKEPTPPLPPWTRTRIAGFAPAVSRIACQAVRAGMGIDAA